MELKEQLINGAIRAQGCAEGLAQLDGAATKAGMLQCFLDRIDFCLARNFPDKEFLKAHFKRELPEKGIYIDEPVQLRNTGAVLLGNCEGRLTADGYAVCRVYVKYGSRLVLDVRENAFVMVDALDEAEIQVRCEEKAKVVVNLYARAKALASGEGITKIVNKKKETYDL